MIPVADDLAHQRRVIGGDVVADELGQIHEAHDAVVEVDPLVHGAELDVADDMVDGLEDALRSARPGYECRRPRNGTRHVGPVGARAVDERVAGVAVRRDRCDPNRAVLVADVMRLFENRRALSSRVRNALVDVRHG